MMPSIMNRFSATATVMVLLLGSFAWQDAEAVTCAPACKDGPLGIIKYGNDSCAQNGTCKLDNGKRGTCAEYKCRDAVTICNCVTPKPTAPTPTAPSPTPPAPAPPTVTPPAGGKNDPHITTWSGETYDYTGFCDVVLLNNPKFQNNLGMRVHIRTRECNGPLCPNRSKISNAAIQIGADVFEVEGPRSTMKHFLNGKELQELPTASNNKAVVGEKKDAFRLGSRSVSVTTNDHWGTQYKYSYSIHLGRGTELLLEVWEDFVNVAFKNVHLEDFEGSMGMMGQYPSGAWVGRDGVTTFDDPLKFGQEWQVQEDEPMLFHDATAPPQAPQTCDAANLAASPIIVGTSGMTSLRGF